MQARMKNPTEIIPEAMQPILALLKAAGTGGVPQSTLELVHLRASQINGCSVCVYGGVQSARKAGVDDDRLTAVAAWRDAPFFSDEERAALAFAEAVTRLADRPDPVPDALWDEITQYYDERQISALVLMIGVTNVFNRMNATTRQVAGATW
jgi:AhpD family alkylhydroperoxidase